MLELLDDDFCNTTYELDCDARFEELNASLSSFALVVTPIVRD